MYTVYILSSEIRRRFYIGYTENIDQRIQVHNGGGVRSTKIYRPWKIIYTESYGNKQDAYRRERQIKSYKGGEAFKRLIKKTLSPVRRCAREVEWS